MIVIIADTESAFALFGGIKGGIEVGEGTSPSAAAAPASARLSGFPCREGDLGGRFKNLTCKMYPVSWCAVENDHQ